jgi:hypothetical protein
VLLANNPFIMKISIHRLRMLLYTHINYTRTENNNLYIEQKITNKIRTHNALSF